MIIRLLQSFSSIALDPEAAPPGSLPPPEWKQWGGRKAIEQIMPKIHITMYSDVRRFPCFVGLVNKCLLSQGGLWVKMEESSN
jgi:hypothetical protein